MIRGLRKKHLQVWTILAFFIPVGIISGWLAVQEKPIDKLVQPAAAETLPVILKTVDHENYAAVLRSNENHSVYQLEWKNKKASTAPSSLVYKITPGIYKGNIADGTELLGRIDARGAYYFPLQKDSANAYSFILYDIIHKQVIDSLTFKITFR